MLLWICFAVLTAAVIAALTRPLMREDAHSGSPAEADMAVYRDQLAEIETDRARGLIDGSEATAARAEIARRLIQRSEADAGSRAGDGAALTGGSRPAMGLVLAAAAFIPVLSVAAYLAVGSPTLSGQPRVAQGKSPVESAPIEELIAKVEARLREKPDEGQGWDVIGPVYALQQRYSDAAQAFARAISILGENPKRLAGFADSAIRANNGIVSEDARRAYERLLVLDPNRLDAHFWLAASKEQDGDLAAAAARYRELLAKPQATAESPWRKVAEERLQVVTGELGKAERSPAGRSSEPQEAPSAAAVASVEKMSPDERARFIERMVGGLAERLKADGKDLPGWLRLVRAYVVLGRNAEATEALAEARRNFADDAKSLSELDALAESLGLGT